MKRVVLALVAVLTGAVAAQGLAPPTREEMIEQLKPREPARPRTRNLRIEDLGPADAAAPQAAAPAPRPSLSLQVQFGFDSAEVLPASRADLRTLASALDSPELKSSRFLVEGHTDAKGARDYNLRLSQRRADAVRDVLAGFGVDAARIRSVGKGPDDPADPADPLAAVNRRVRVVNID